MSSRFLYRTLKPENRRCNYYRCQKRILRNIATDKACRLYHWGCLQTALDEQYRCQDCALTFDATEAVLEEKQKFIGDEIKELLGIVCPNCSSHSVRPAARHHRMPDGALVTCT